MNYRLPIAAALFLALPAPTVLGQQTPENPPPRFILGVKLNQGVAGATIGATSSLSNRLTLYTGTDVQPNGVSPTAQILYRVTRPARFQIHAVAGPQLEILQNTYPPDNPTVYLTAATGALLTARINTDFTLWAGANYLLVDANIVRWKIALGIAFRLSPN